MSVSDSEAEMLTGVVKWYNVRRNYGFIRSVEDSSEIFVHATGIQEYNRRKLYRSLCDGEMVKFMLTKCPQGVKATRVTGMTGGPVRGSPYTPDKTAYRKHILYLRERQRYVKRLLAVELRAMKKLKEEAMSKNIDENVDDIEKDLQDFTNLNIV